MNPIITAVGTITGWNVFASVKIWTMTFLMQMAFYTGTVTGDFTQYKQMKAAGVPCWTQLYSGDLPTMGGGIQSRIQPACPYDPANTNPGYLAGPVETREVVEK